MKYTVLKDITIFGKTVAGIGSHLNSDANGVCTFVFNGNQIEVNISDLPTDSIKQIEELDIYIKELPITNKETPSTWRLQLDVTTTATKAKAIENFLREVLPDMI